MVNDTDPQQIVAKSVDAYTNEYYVHRSCFCVEPSPVG